MAAFVTSVTLLKELAGILGVFNKPVDAGCLAD